MNRYCKSARTEGKRGRKWACLLHVVPRCAAQWEKKEKKKERNFLDFTIFIMTYTGTVLEYSYIVDRLHCIPCFTSFFKQVKKKNQKSRRSHEVGDALFGSFLFYFIFPFKTTPSVGTLSYVWTSHECGV